MFAWLKAHWELIALILGVLISILNAATVHWSESKGLVKVLLFIVDCLSIIRSKGTSGSVLGNAKIPGVPTGATGIVDGRIISGTIGCLLLAALLGGCCAGKPRCYLASALKASGAAGQLAIPAIQTAYTPKVKACGNVPSEKCPAYAEGVKAIDTAKASLAALRAQLDLLNKLLASLGVP